MHLIEDVLQLALHLHACVDAQFAQFSRDSVKRLLALSHVNNHHHVEILLHDSLRNVEDVYLIVCQIGADLSNDTHRILAHNCNNCSCHILFVFMFFLTHKNTNKATLLFLIDYTTLLKLLSN